MRATLATGSAPSDAPRVARANGFTLLELMVVIAILALMTAVLPWALDRALPGRRVETTAERLAAAIRDAQSLSLASGGAVRLQMREGIGLSRSERLVVAFPPSTSVKLVDAEERAAGEIIAYPDGTATPVRFEVTARSHHASVLVSGVTGRVTLVEHRS